MASLLTFAARARPPRYCSRWVFWLFVPAFLLIYMSVHYQPSVPSTVKWIPFPQPKPKSPAKEPAVENHKATSHWPKSSTRQRLNTGHVPTATSAPRPDVKHTAVTEEPAQDLASDHIIKTLAFVKSEATILTIPSATGLLSASTTSSSASITPESPSSAITTESSAKPNDPEEKPGELKEEPEESEGDQIDDGIQSEHGDHEGGNPKKPTINSTKPVPRPRTLFNFSKDDKRRLTACSQVPFRSLLNLRNSTDISVHTFFQGKSVGDQPLESPARICVLVAVPQAPPPRRYFLEAPVPGKWPDTIHLFLSSDSVRSSIPPLRALPSQPNAHQLFSKEPILYYAEVKLPAQGVYHVEAEQEAHNWYWARHGWGEADQSVLKKNQAEMKHMRGMGQLEKFEATKEINKDRMRIYSIPKSQMFPADIHVAAAKSNQTFPLCHSIDKFDINKGEWYNVENFTRFQKAAADEFGYAFDPDMCHLDYFSDRDVADCLSDKVIHVYGDSNARRLSKTLLSGGRWCHDLTHKCQGEDNGDPVTKIVLNNQDKVVEKIEPMNSRAKFGVMSPTPFTFGNKTKLYFTFLTSMAYEPQHWLGRLYDRDAYRLPPKPKKGGKKKKGSPQPFEKSHVHSGAHARQPKVAKEADLVIVSMSSWDDAFDVKFHPFEDTMSVYRDALMEAYSDPETKLVLRLNQGYCCRGRFEPSNLRRFTGGRLQHFGDMARKAFRVKGGSAMDGRMSVVDSSALSGRPEVVKAYTKGQRSSNHLRAAEVRTEMQVLLNNICTRSESGKAIWKPRKKT